MGFLFHYYPHKSYTKATEAISFVKQQLADNEVNLPFEYSAAAA
jgi:hypothetical protein